MSIAFPGNISIRATRVPRDKAGQPIDGARENLSTWRVEPGSGPQTVRVTYHYEIDESLQRGNWEVSYSLPSGITVRANPPLF